MTQPPARGLPPRVYIPILAVVAIVFLGIVADFVRIAYGVTGSAIGPGVAASRLPAEQGDARIAATPVPQTGGALPTL
ncbi:MAG: hypothetical protein ACREM6_03725, partial [Vulcanimicrobiaceae bacterium]